MPPSLQGATPAVFLFLRASSSVAALFPRTFSDIGGDSPFDFGLQRGANCTFLRLSGWMLQLAFLHYSFILCKYFRVQCIKEKDAATCLPSSCRTWVCTQMKALIHMEGKRCFVCRFLGFICQFEPEEMQQGSSQFEPDPKQIGVPIIMARN